MVRVMPPAACTYYEDNQSGMALMDAEPPHVRRCPRCDGVVVLDGGNWRHVEFASSAGEPSAVKRQELLADAIVKIAEAAGFGTFDAMTGPEVLLIAEDVAAWAREQRACADGR